jgi:hypothetical protein
MAKKVEAATKATAQHARKRADQDLDAGLSDCTGYGIAKANFEA